MKAEFLRVVLAALATTFLGACQSAPPRRLAAPDPVKSVEKAVAFLKSEQYGPGKPMPPGMEAGDFPHFVTLSALFLRGTRRESSPFAATFIHEALCTLGPSQALRLGLPRETVQDAAAMRRACLRMFPRFAIPAENPSAGVYGFWKERSRERTPGQMAMGRLLFCMAGGPQWDGFLAPAYSPAALPTALMAWPDMDDTAAINACLHKGRVMGEAPAGSDRWIEALTEARDLPGVRRTFPNWLQPDSGAFTTWAAIPGRPHQPASNDVDVLVNASVLYGLAVAGRLDVPGAAEAAALINRATRDGRHRQNSTATLYYPDSFFYHYLVSRAFAHGATALAPAVQILRQDLERSACLGPDGDIQWERRGEPALTTSLAVLTLVNSGMHPRHPMIAGAVRSLTRLQDPDGGWQDTEFCRGKTDSGVLLRWHSRATTTAFCLQAIARHLRR